MTAPLQHAPGAAPAGPGPSLLLEAAGRRGLLPVAQVREVVRLVALEPVAGGGPGLAGRFSCRGVPVLALDLARLLGVARLPDLDAHLVVLEGAPAAALLVDRVLGLLEPPVPAPGAPGGWERSGLAVARCALDGGEAALLDAAAARALARAGGEGTP